jgi:xanthine dehydrogenase accessory factor
MRELLSELTAALKQKRSCVFCSVVETRGSTPQKAGAAMLVFADGSQRGTLGGGCVEAEVRQRALRTLADDGALPEVLTFSLDDNYGWDDGLICGGRMTIVADPLPASAVGDRKATSQDYYTRLMELVAGGSGCTEAVVTEKNGTGLAVGTRLLFDSNGRLVAQSVSPAAGSKPTDAALAEVTRQLPAIRERPRPSLRKGIAYLPVPPRITLLIVGGGHVGHAVARLAADCDFNIWVLDDRDRYASRERFPAAQKLLVGDIGETLRDLVQAEIDASTFGMIVTRGHAHDEEALYHLAPSRAAYVGMIGSKRKIKLIYEDLIARGLSEETLARVHAPLGLAIGSQTVPEIAISILAELIACRNLGESADTHDFRRDSGGGKK